MEIRIFDVEHGFCACVFTDNGRVILIDCGHNAQTGFRPSSYLWNLGVRAIDVLVISNYDEDHVSDLPALARDFEIRTWHRNQSIPRAQLRALKEAAGGIGPGMNALLHLIRVEVDVPSPLADSGIEIIRAHNDYPTFDDTNNLSLVTFLHYGDVHIVFPGDLEVAGWRDLLALEAFRGELAKTNLFVAAHHGRASGYCPEVFDHCWPDLVIISDSAVVHETQQVDYAPHASGVSFNGGITRRVLTTRSDGMIRVRQEPGGGVRILTSH